MMFPNACTPAPVAATKVRPPRLHAHSIRRARVRDLVARGAERPLTVLSAPAGWGKTTALLDWVAGISAPVAWVSLDRSDEDPRRLWEHLLAAVDRVFPGAVEDARAALRGGTDVLDAVVPLTVNALDRHADGEVALVLDDYEQVRSEAAHRSVVALLDAIPSNVHVVIASRTTPPLRLGRRRAAGTAVEIGQRELAFAPAEAAELLNARWGLALGEEELALVERRVAGWPAGLALVAATLARADAGAPFAERLARADELLEEYLVEEVLDPMAPPVRELLVRTAMLPRLVPSLGAVVAALPDARAALAEARRAGLLVPEPHDDGRGVWLRCHVLLADLLRRELADRPPELVRELHLRASEWFEREGLPEEAIMHASRAGDGRRAARLLFTAAGTLLGHSQHATTRRLVEEMPPERGEYGPFAEAAHALASQHAGVEPALVYERWEALTEQRDAPGMACIVDTARVWPFFGRIGEAVRLGWRAYEQHAGAPEPTRHAIAAQLGLALWFAGQATESRALIERHLEAMVYPASTTWAHAALALGAAERGDGERAHEHAARAVALAVEHDRASELQFAIAYQAQADALRVLGRLQAGGDVLDHAERVTGRHPGSLHHALSLILRAELQVARHERHDARRVAAEAEDVLARFPDVGALGARLAALTEHLRRRADDGLLGSAPTAAEQRVLELLADGRTLEVIARELFVSIHTVKSHTRRLYRRLGVRSRLEAIDAARERGLLP